MAFTLDDLFASPEHYLHSFDGEDAVFVPMDRDSYHRSIFLDRRISPAKGGSMRLPFGSLSGRIPAPAATAWIFHVAHCGSTLLARALDDVSTNLVLREPLALRQLALAPDAERLAVTMAMLSKRFRPDLATLVKANVPVNFLLPELVTFDAQARAIFLHAGLRDYLLAILRSDNHRAWLRGVTTQLASHLGDLSALPDAERGAALWLAQMQAYARVIASLPNARSLDAEAFFSAPRPILELAARHLEVPIGEGELDARVGGPLFATYSKNPGMAFDNEARLARRRELETSLDDELDAAEAWIARKTGEAEAALKVIVQAKLDA